MRPIARSRAPNGKLCRALMKLKLTILPLFILFLNKQTNIALTIKLGHHYILSD